MYGKENREIKIPGLNMKKDQLKGSEKHRS
jgi:hypothetical protein